MDTTKLLLFKGPNFFRSFIILNNQSQPQLMGNSRALTRYCSTIIRIRRNEGMVSVGIKIKIEIDSHWTPYSVVAKFSFYYYLATP